MKKKQGFGLLAVVAALTLAGCSTQGIDREAEARAMSARPAAPADNEWPAPQDARWKQGTFPNVENLRKMAPGMGKDQVRELLGVPHFSEGLGGVREWNYLFHLRTGPVEYKTCQYMVRYDNTPLVVGSWWRDPACAALLNPAPVVVPAPAAPTMQPPQKISMGADGLFRFGGGSTQDLLPGARERIQKLAQEVSSNFKVLQYINVTGYTDRIGSDQANLALSRERANTVRELLVQGGIDGSKVRATGMGKQNPLATDCRGTRATPELVQCLQPNRRVEIEVLGGY